MNLFKAILRLFRFVLLWLLAVYWITFVGYTIKNLAAGGPVAAVTWYKHISGAVFEWNWGVFLARQFAILVLTLTIWFFGRRLASHEIGNP
jgi:hypothetical protein